MHKIIQKGGELLRVLSNRMGNIKFKVAPRLISHRLGKIFGLYSPYFYKWLIINKTGMEILNLFSSPLDFAGLLIEIGKNYHNENGSEAALKCVNELIKNRIIINCKITDADCLRTARRDFKEHCQGVGTLYILFSLRCNFNCSYCYHIASFPKIDYSTLTFEMFKKGVDLFAGNYNGVHGPKFLFGGGEPLLNMDLLRRSVAYIQKLESKFAFGDNEAVYSILTNASLITRDIARYLKANEFGVGVSIDGTAKIHDGYRKYSSGHGTFKDVMRGIERLSAQDINCSINLTIGRHNISTICKELEWLSKNVSKNFRFNFMCNFFHGNNDAIPKKNMILGKLDKIYDFCSSYGINEKTLNGYFESFDGAVPIYSHCAGMGGQIVISPYGTIGPCHHLIAARSMKYFSKPQDGNVNVYSLPQWRGWLTRSPVINKLCATNCSYITICGGGCAANALANGLQLKDYDPSICHLSKFYLRYYLKTKARDGLDMR